MTYLTEERLRSHLDANQLQRERLCLALLAIDKRYSEVRPRHPFGGPDGGRDIEARLRDGKIVFGAVGFVNHANDSKEQITQISKKFRDDLANALKHENNLGGFIFFTNINLSHSEKEKLSKTAIEKGISHCEIIDRERMRISLDSSDGFSIRFQYLNMTLSEPEQATFFARWGDDIQAVISTGLQKIESTLQRVLFYQEAADTLNDFTVVLDLDREYSAAEINHFRAFCILYLKEPRHRVLGLVFGITDKGNRFGGDFHPEETGLRPGIEHGFSGGQWLHMLRSDRPEDFYSQFEPETNIIYSYVGGISSGGQSALKSLTFRYSNDELVRVPPSLNLRDLDESMFVLALNESLAKTIKKIHIFANAYKLKEYTDVTFGFDKDSGTPKIPVPFNSEELADEWVLIRPRNESHFHINFADETPKRMFAPNQVMHNLKTHEFTEENIEPTEHGT